MDVKTLSGAAGLYREGPHARSNQRGAPVAERARKVHVDYVGRARALDHAHSRQADGTPYPGVREHTCGTMSLIMRCDLIVKSSLLIMSPFGLIIRTMSQQ